MGENLKKIFNSKPKIYFAIIIVILFIFGFLKPFFSVSSTSYLFGMIEKSPDAKGLLKQYFRGVSMQNEDKLIYQPFGNFLFNVDENFDPSNVSFSSQQEADMARKNATWWSYNTTSKVINKLEFLGCGEKTSVDSEVGYRCKFILNNLSGTGLNEKMVDGRSQSYELSMQVKDHKYTPFRFKSVSSFD